MNTSDPQPPSPLSTSGSERLFPILTPSQIARIAAQGRRRPTAQGDVLVDVGEKDVPFFVVVSGEIEVVRPSGRTETLIVRHGAGQFSGETNMISGRRS